jgi:protein BCP1
MPHAVMPPLYNFLHTEILSAAQSSPAHNFTHYLLLSKTYTEVASQLDIEPEQGSSKKSKKAAAAAANPEVFYFHPEDEALHRHALAYGNYDYVKQGDEGASDAKRAFQEMGIRPQGHLILIEAGRFEGAVKAVAEYLGGTE